jgi:hypothetical protein
MGLANQMRWPGTARRTIVITANQARDLGEGLQRLRIRKGLTCYQAAEVCGLPHIVYAGLEHGRMPANEAEALVADAWAALQLYRVANADATPPRIRHERYGARQWKTTRVATTMHWSPN